MRPQSRSVNTHPPIRPLPRTPFTASQGTADAAAAGTGGGFTSHAQEAMGVTLAAFFARMPRTKCANCMAVNPIVRKQGATKLFRVFGSAKAALANRMRGISLVGEDGEVGGGPTVRQGCVCRVLGLGRGLGVG
jgi:hypothetical protein